MHSFVSGRFFFLLRNSWAWIFMLVLFAMLLYHLLYFVKQGLAQCQKIQLDSKQLIALVEIHSESGQNHVTRQKMRVVCASGGDDNEMVVAASLY